jgi:hypothetical protein
VGKIVAAEPSTENHWASPPLATGLLIRQSMLEVKKHLRPAEIDAWPTTTHVGGYLRTIGSMSMVMIQLTSTTSSMIEDA